MSLYQMGNYKTFPTSLIHSILSILIIYLMTSNLTVSALDFWDKHCPDGTTNRFVKNSDYEANLNTLFDYLTTNSTNPSGYHQAAVNNTVYGHFQCRNDLPTSTCKDCVATAIYRDIPTNCPNQKVAVLWYSQCVVRYSNQLFFGQIETHPMHVVTSQDDVTGNVAHFDEVLGDMVENVIAVRAANGGDKKFVAYAASFTDKQTIFGMGQCTSDLSPIQCKICLSVYGFHEYSRKWGAKFYNPSCILRYEMYPFFDLSLLDPPPPPPSHHLLPRPPPSSGSYGSIKRKHHHHRHRHHHHRHRHG